MLGEALNVRVVGLRGGRGSLAAEGFEREGRGFVKQAHYWPGERGNLAIDPNKKQGIVYLHLVRHPLDIAVSVAHYWDWPLDVALDKMIDGPGPLELPPWSVYVKSWLGEYVPILRYEDFHDDARGELDRILSHLGLQAQRDLAEVVEHQSFAVKREELEKEGNRYPFGREAQLKHMRRGAVGSWRQEFSREQEKRARIAWNGLLKGLGYDA